MMMRVSQYQASLVTLFLGVFPARGNAQSSSVTAYDSIFDRLMDLPASARAGSEAGGLTLEREGISLILESGRMYLLAPVANRTIAAVFIGEGKARLTPPNRVEREQLKRVLKSDSLERRF